MLNWSRKREQAKKAAILAEEIATLDKQVLKLAENGFDNLHRDYLRGEHQITQEWVVMAGMALDCETSEVWEAIDRLRAAKRFRWQVRKKL
jgi:hypothetical protein